MTRARFRRRSAVAACAWLAVAAGCGGGSETAPAAGPGEAAGPPGDPLGLGRDLEATVLENYSLLELGNIDALADRLATDRAIAFFGVEPGDAIAGVAPPGIWEDRRLFAGSRVRMLSRNLDIHLSDDRSVGWVFDEVSYRVPVDGREAVIPLRVTSVYTRDIGRWVLAMQHTSYPIPIDELVPLAREGRLAEPGRFQTGYRVDGPATDLRRIAWRVISGAIGPHYRERRMADSAQSLVLLPGPRQEYVGRRVRDAPTLAEIFAAPGGEEAEVELGDHRIEVAQSGEVAWMAANFGVLVAGDAEASSVSAELRATFVFEKRPDRGWVVVQTHVSAGVPEEVIAERVFGARGVGPAPER